MSLNRVPQSMVKNNTALPISSSQNVTTAHNRAHFVASASLTLSLGLTNAYPNGFSFFVLALGGNVTVTPAGSENIQAKNKPTIVHIGTSARFISDGAGNWYMFESVPTSAVVGGRLAQAALAR